LIYEAFFIFGVIWAFGAPLSEDRIQFSNQIRGMSKPKIPDGGVCWGYFFDPLQLTSVSWEGLVQKMDTAFDGLFQNLVVPTMETTR